MKKIIFILILAINAHATVLAQQIRGYVTTSQHTPIPGATVQVQNHSQSVQTDKNGNFEIIPPANISELYLLVRHIGYQEVRYRVNSQDTTVHRITLLEQSAVLDTVVINTGYQQLPRERSTGSFEFVDNARLNEQTGVNIIDRLEGIVNSLSLDRRTNAGGMMIRGLSTIEGGREPLIILDNFPFEGNIENINPNDVESISVLKDAAAASIWGARAGNGVIVITTKSGHYDQPVSVGLTANLSFIDKPDLYYQSKMTSADFIAVERMLFENNHFSSQETSSSRPPLSPAVEYMIAERDGHISPSELEERLNALASIDIRRQYMDYVYETGVNQQYHLGIQGGSKILAWNVGAGVDNNVSHLAVKTRRYSLTSKKRFFIGSRLQGSLNLSYTQSERNGGKDDLSSLSNVSGDAPPYTEIIDPNGIPQRIARGYRLGFLDTLGGGHFLDWDYVPLEDYKHRLVANKRQNLSAQVVVNHKVMEGLDAQVSYQYQRQATDNGTLYREESYFARDLINSYSQVQADGEVLRAIPIGGIKTVSHGTLWGQNLRAQASYNKDWNKHQLSILAGGELRDIQEDGFRQRYYGFNEHIYSAANMDYLGRYYYSINGSTRAIPSDFGFSGTVNRYVSFFGNGAYTYAGKYTLTGSMRRDASNLFGVNTNDKWNPLWSVGGAWLLSGERFHNETILPYARIRVTYGKSGNINPRMVAVTTISYGGVSQLTNAPYATFSNHFNPDLRWEKVATTNIALDFRLAKGRLSGSIEYYRKSATDLFGDEPIDYTSGVGRSITRNVASMRAHGLDVTLKSVNVEGTLKWTSDLFVNYYRDKVTDYYLASMRGSNFVSGISISGMEGYPVHALFSYRFEGLDPETGDPLGVLNGAVSKDYNELIGANTLIDDLVYHGTVYPKIFGALGNTWTWHNLSLTARLSYKFGYYFRRNTIQYGNLYSSRIAHGDFERRWLGSGDEQHTNIPSMIYPAVNNRDAFFANSTATAERGDHIRLQYINLAYAIRRAWLPAKTARISLMANNLGILYRANRQGLDPDYTAIPPSRTYSLSLNIDL